MSSDQTQSALSRAYELVEAGNYSDAQAIIAPILAADKDNADAWWVYAHAVTDPEAGREALENVLRIDPQYPGAADLQTQAQARFPSRPKITPLAQPAAIPAAPPTLPEVEMHAAPRSARPPRRSLRPLIAVLVVIVVVAVAVLLLLTQNGAPPATPTAVAVVQATETSELNAAATTEATASVTETAMTTAEATSSPAAATAEPTTEMMPAVTEAVMTEAATAEVLATQPVVAVTSEPATPEAAATESAAAATAEPTVPVAATAENSAETFALIEQSLAAFPVAESGVGQVDTSLGKTLLVTVCTSPGRAMRSLLPQVMNALALKSPTLGTSVDALGVRMLDCTANTPLLTVAVELKTAQSFARGEVTSSDFAGTWQPQ